MLSVSLPLVPVLVGYVLASLTMLFLLVYTVREMDDTATLRYFAVLLGLLALWSWAFAGRMVAQPLGTKLVFHYIATVAIAFVPVTWLVFALVYTGREHFVKRWTVAALLLPALATQVLVMWNPDGLYYRSVETASIAGAAVIDLEVGPLHWVASSYNVLLLAVGLVLLAGFARSSDRLYRVQSVSLVAAGGLPLALHLVFVAGLSPVPSVDPTPITFALSGLLVAVAVYYGEFVRVLPVARERVMETLDAGIVVADDVGRVRYANPAARGVLSVADDTVIGSSVTDCFPWSVTDGSGTREVSVEGAEGREWYQLRELPFHRGEAVAGTIYIFTTITDRKRLEEKLRALQRTATVLMVAETAGDIGDIVVGAVRDVLELPAAALWTYDAEGECLEPVAAAEGVDIDALPVLTAGDGDPWATFEAGDLRVVTGAATLPGERGVEMQVPVGRRGLIVAARPDAESFADIDAELLRILASVTEQALVRADREQQLRERERELARENERLEEFTSVVAHDLRSPLNSADIFLEKLAAETDDERLDRVKSAHERTKSLVEDLLALARQGTAVEEPEPVEVATVAERAWESVPTADATLDVEPGCGTVLADASRLRQLFENLYGNAVEHAGETVSIRVGPLPSGFFVADDGPGIPEEERSQVFDHGYTSTAEGTGFGLAIVRRIVEAHGWSVGATASANGGLRIEVSGVRPASVDDGPDSPEDSGGPAKNTGDVSDAPENPGVESDGQPS